MEIPVYRWGKPYESLEKDEIVHFATGRPVATLNRAVGALVARDLRQAPKARRALKAIDPADLLAMVQKAGELFQSATLPMGDTTQSPDQFVHQQSATTGLPEAMCRANMAKNGFVMTRMDQILEALTRGLDPKILARGYGMESRGVVVSYQAQTPVLGAVLPNNSPGVHTLWLPAIPLQVGLVLKPGSAEPWTPYRVMSAMVEAGVPREVFGLYPGGHDVGGAILSDCPRSMIFGSQKTVDQYAGNPKVSVHGPGFSKILIGDDVVDDWEAYLDLMVDSVYVNGGRSCINASAIYASRHTREIARALAERLGPVEAKEPDDPAAGLAAFTTPGMGKGVWELLEKDLAEPGVTDMTAEYGPRLVDRERYAYLRPVIAHAESPAAAIAKKEFMFPFATVVACPQAKMIDAIGYTLVGTALTRDRAWIEDLTEATHIDRLNIGPIPTTKLNWLQPHEGNIIDFLFRSRAYQLEEGSVPMAV